MLPENEVTEFENRTYLNPQTGLDETNQFIENYRATQQADTAQIQEQARNLGTDVPSNLGGLIGGEGYFTSRYQTPQTITALNDLRATAQAAALNQALSNQQEMWKQRYNEAYRAAKKRARARAAASSSNTDTTGTSGPGKGEVELQSAEDKYGDQSMTTRTSIDLPYAKPGQQLSSVYVGDDLYIVDETTGKSYNMSNPGGTNYSNRSQGVNGGGGGGGW